MTRTTFVAALLLLGLAGTALGQKSLDSRLAELMRGDAKLAKAWNAAAAAGWALAERQAVLSLQPLPDLKLAVARELVRQRMLDDAAPLLKNLKTSEVGDAAALLFHRACCLHWLGDRNGAQSDLEALEAMKDVPERYRQVAKQIRATERNLKPESLAGIAHDARELTRRLETERPDLRTRELQKSVRERLDRIIADLEKQRQQQPNPPNGQPNNPQDESHAMPGGAAEANAEPEEKKFRDYGAWGNLPPKQREKALQSIGRDFPPHYRSVVEEYFRKLSERPSGGKP